MLRPPSRQHKHERRYTPVILTRRRRKDDYDGQMISGDLVGLKLPDICLTGEEKPRKNLTQETCPNRGLNLGVTGVHATGKPTKIPVFSLMICKFPPYVFLSSAYKNRRCFPFHFKPRSILFSSIKLKF